MPFHDKEWEEIQRDWDIFPAYSDYLYGPDRRLVVTQEPGLHPLIYPTPTPQPAQNANGMPTNPLELQRRLRTVTEKEESRRQAMSQQHSHAYVPSTSRRDTHSTPVGVAQQQYQAHNSLTPTQQTQYHQPSVLMSSAPTQIPSSALRPTQNLTLQHSAHSVVQSSPIFPEVTGTAGHQAFAQLRAYINSRIPQVWHCLQRARQNLGPTSQDALQEQHRAAQWLLSFKYSIPREGQIYLAQVVAHMNAENAAGRDPLLSLGFRA